MKETIEKPDYEFMAEGPYKDRLRITKRNKTIIITVNIDGVSQDWEIDKEVFR